MAIVNYGIRVKQDDIHIGNDESPPIDMVGCDGATIVIPIHGVMTEEEIDRLKERWMDMYRGPRPVDVKLVPTDGN